MKIIKDLAGVIVLIALFLSLKNLHCTPHHSGSEMGGVAAATFSIDSKYGTAGRGILVGYKSGIREKVFLLTARHVATFEDLIDKEMTLYLDWTKKWKVTSKKDRWLTCRRELDAAWMELNEKEFSELRDRGLLNYIHLDEILDYGQLCRNCEGSRVSTKMFFKDGVETGEMIVEVPRSAPIPFLFNHNLHICEIPIVRVYSDNLTTPGDSGCPAFIETADGWRLVGLVVGGNENLRVNAVMPLDEVVGAIMIGGDKLVNHPELW